MIAETANVNYRLSFAGQGKLFTENKWKLAFPFYICSKLMEAAIFH
jgi:hypothetical protein